MATTVMAIVDSFPTSILSFLVAVGGTSFYHAVSAIAEQKYAAA
jgi:hypothetical protein